MVMFYSLQDGACPDVQVSGQMISYVEVLKFVRSLPLTMNFVVVEDNRADYIMLAPMSGADPYCTR